MNRLAQQPSRWKKRAGSGWTMTNICMLDFTSWNVRFHHTGMVSPKHTACVTVLQAPSAGPVKHRLPPAPSQVQPPQRQPILCNHVQNSGAAAPGPTEVLISGSARCHSRRCNLHLGHPCCRSYLCIALRRLFGYILPASSALPPAPSMLMLSTPS